MDILDAAFSMATNRGSTDRGPTDRGSTDGSGRIASVAPVASVAVPDSGAVVPAATAVATPVASAALDLGSFIHKVETFVDEKSGTTATVLASGEISEIREIGPTREAREIRN